MRRLLLILALTCLPIARAATPTNVMMKDTRTIKLFNGHDFTGLYIYAEPAAAAVGGWTIENGVLHCLGVGKGYVRTTAAYSDYKLTVEWRWPAKPGNSGVLVNITGPDCIWPKSFENQLAAGHAGDYASFSDARSKEEMVSHNPTGVSTGRLKRNPDIPVEKPPGEWNRYDIVVSGDTITTSVNGVLVNHMTGVIPSGGMILLQNEGAPVDFRNFELTPLPAAKDLNAAMPVQ